MADRFELTDNERLRLELVRHQIFVLRYASGLGNTTEALLSASEDQLRALIVRRTGPLAGRPYSPSVERRLRALLERVRELRRRAVRGAFEAMRVELRAFSVAEGRYAADAANLTSSVELGVATVLASTLRALVDHDPFEGRVLRDWAAKVEADDLARIEAALRRGLVEGATPQQMSRAVAGSVSARGSDGLTQMTRNESRTIARTVVNSLANAARSEVFEANAGVISKEQYVAVLDSRTTLICSSLDGTTYDVGKGPFPPQHFNCRSVRVAVIDKEVAGRRPMKPITEQEVLRRYNAANGTTSGSRATLPQGHKSRFDTFARVQVRKITGTVPARTTYQEFFARQPAWFQNDVLGRTRARLFRRGGLTLDKFVDRSGRSYTLAELARRQRAAFLRAGLDPEKFR